MSIVPDASVVVAALTDAGAVGAWAEQALGRDDLVAPHLLHAEASSILRRLERNGELSPVEATGAQRDLMALPVELAPFEPFAARVWALRANVTSYDAWYVAIAEALGYPLATLDRKLTKATGPRCDFLTP